MFLQKPARCQENHFNRSDFKASDLLVSVSFSFFQPLPTTKVFDSLALL